MPIANVIRIMRRILPTHAKISDDAKETIQECVSEYISFITSEANERCQREQRKTITAEDVLWAMGKLGFDDYIHPLTLYLHRYRDFEGASLVVKRSAHLPDLSSLAAAGPSYGPGFHVAHHRGLFAPAGSTINGYLNTDNGSNLGPAGHSAAMPTFDPYMHAPFK